MLTVLCTRRMRVRRIAVAVTTAFLEGGGWALLMLQCLLALVYYSCSSNADSYKPRWHSRQWKLHARPERGLPKESIRQPPIAANRCGLLVTILQFAAQALATTTDEKTKQQLDVGTTEPRGTPRPCSPSQDSNPRGGSSLRGFAPTNAGYHGTAMDACKWT